MKKTILKYMVISILLIGIASAFNPFDNLKSYLDLNYGDSEVIGNSSKYELLSNHVATDVSLDGKNYTVFMTGNDYDNAVIISYVLEVRIQELENRVQVIENNLDITDLTIPQEPETDLYSCSYKESKECLGGLSGLNRDNVSTRCYNILKLGWSVCSDNVGWVLV